MQKKCAKKIVMGLLLPLLPLLFSLVALTPALTEDDIQLKPARSEQTLATLKSFEVYQFHDTYAIETKHVPPEIFMYVKSALSKDSQFPMASPAEGTVHLECIRYNCGLVRMWVTVGANGKTIWETTEKTRKTFDWPLDQRDISKNLAQKLLNAYHTAYH
ncbi:MAG: hypothetical protein K2X01_03005 [Cyanobacteria bacterium]|nr:hypothetical protein [Cyanobacteriota bacterium]